MGMDDMADKRDFLSVTDLFAGETRRLIARAMELKAARAGSGGGALGKRTPTTVFWSAPWQPQPTI